MRVLILLLLTAALSMELARSLSCYQCKGFGGCMRKNRCPPRATHCFSVATRPLKSPVDLPLVTKSCSSGCPNINNLAPHASLACCQASLCNVD